MSEHQAVDTTTRGLGEVGRENATRRAVATQLWPVPSRSLTQRFSSL